MPSEVPLVIFARAPRPGATKTRLIGALGAERAARLYAAFVTDVRRKGDLAGLREQLWVAHPDDVDAYEAPRLQRGADLGARMSHALGDALERADRALLIGTDSPTLPAAYLRLAADALDAADVVFGPSADGGYYLIGARGSAPALGGASVRWSTPHALADSRAKVAGRRVATLPPWYDVDTPEDLRLLRVHLALDPRAAPATAAALAAF